MSFTIGRASLPVDPSSARWSGDQLTITGWISPTTANDTNHAYALRQQLLGLVNNPDEQVFPCTFSVDPNWDGYYYVNSVNIDGDPGLMEIQGRMPYSITLTRLAAGYARPQIETVYSGVVRTNAHGIAAPTGAYSAFYSPSSYVADGTLPPSSTAPGEDGSFYISTAAFPVATTSGTIYTAPADYYKTGARIEVKYGSTWYPVQGMQIPLAVGLNWRISNGFTRVYPSQVSANGRFTVERYKSGAWVGREMQLGTFSAGWNVWYATADASGNAFVAKVLTNSVALCAVRVAYGKELFDFTLRQGDNFIELAITSTGTAKQYGIATATATASTAFTGGARATANDANGLRYLISFPQAVTTDLVNGYVYATAAFTTNAFQICPDYQTGPLAVSDAGVRDLFFAMRSERRQVVPR